MFTKYKYIGFRTPFVALLFILIVSAPALFAQNKEMPITASKDALALYMEARDKTENLNDPGDLYEQAIAKDPNFAMAYIVAGRTNQEFRANLEKAVALADKVSPGEREWILAFNDQVNGNLEGRKKHLDALIKLFPGDKRVQSQMGFYYRGIGDSKTSLKYFEESANLDKNYAAAYNNIGYGYLAMENFPKAEAAFKTYIKLIPNNPNPYDSYAEMLMKAGKFDQSIVQYQKALSVDPTFFNSYRGMGNDYVYKGDYAKARESYKTMYEKALDDNGRDQALSSEMNSYIDEGKIDEALAVNARRIALAEKNNDVATLIGLHNLSGFIMVEAGRLDDAAKELAMADKQQNDPSLPEATAANRQFFRMLNSARLLTAQGKFDAAKAELDGAGKDLAARPNVNRERTYNGGMGFLELGQKNYSKAAESFAKGNPLDPYMWYYRAVALEGAGDKKTASSLYLKVVNWNSLDTPGHAFVRSRAKDRLKAIMK